MKKWFSVGFLCAFLLLTIAANSSAELASDELLQILKEKGLISDQDIEKAKESRKGKKVAVNAARQPKSINFKGRVQVRFTSLQNGDLSKVTSQKSFENPNTRDFVSGASVCGGSERLSITGNITCRSAWTAITMPTNWILQRPITNWQKMRSA